jgi:hypothetical protein
MYTCGSKFKFSISLERYAYLARYLYYIWLLTLVGYGDPKRYGRTRVLNLDPTRVYVQCAYSIVIKLN